MNHALFGLLEQKARNNNLKQYSRILSNESKVKYNNIFKFSFRFFSLYIT